MDLSVKDILNQYPNLSEDIVGSNEVVATTNTISKELKARFEDRRGCLLEMHSSYTTATIPLALSCLVQVQNRELNI